MNSCRRPPTVEHRAQERIAELLRRYVCGDEAAFTQLHATLRPQLRKVALRLVGEVRADDVVQSAFLRAHRAARRFQIPSADPDRAVIGWFRKILRHVVVDDWRRQCTEADGRRRYANLPRESVCLEESIIRNELALALQASIRALPQAKRRLIERRLTGTSFAEIGRELGVSSGAARVRAHRLYRELASRLGHHADTQSPSSHRRRC